MKPKNYNVPSRYRGTLARIANILRKRGEAPKARYILACARERDYTALYEVTRWKVPDAVRWDVRAVMQGIQGEGV